MNTILTKRQEKTFTVTDVLGYKLIKAVVRYDDRCGNGHNTFSITGSAYATQREIIKDDPSTCGCIHEIIEKAFPELAHLIKWHLVSSDGPLHYISNTMFDARSNLSAARSCAVWPDATLEQLQNKELLLARLPALMIEFKADIEALGFTF